MIEIKPADGSLIDFYRKYEKDAYFPECNGFSVFRDGELVGGFLYDDYRFISNNSYTIQVHFCGVPGFITRRVLNHQVEFMFNHLRCSVVRAFVPRYKKRVRRMVGRLGFEYCGFVPSGLTSGYDVFMYAMTRQNCKWFKNGFSESTLAARSEGDG